MKSNDYQNYGLPLARTLIDYKHMQGAQVEQDTGFGLFTKPDFVKSIVHFDTTLRSLDGE